MLGRVLRDEVTALEADWISRGEPPPTGSGPAAQLAFTEDQRRLFTDLRDVAAQYHLLLQMLGEGGRLSDRDKVN